jgi:hypothetical protein
METITLDRLVSTIRELVAARPDYVYEPPESAATCVYIEVDEPGDGYVASCGIGHVLFRIDPVITNQFLGRRGHNSADIKRLCRSGIVPAEDQLTVHAMAVFQAHQDNGMPWAFCEKHMLTFIDDNQHLKGLPVSEMR